MFKKFNMILIVLLMIFLIYDAFFNPHNKQTLNEIFEIKNEPIEIRFVSSWGGEDNKSGILDQVLNEFNSKHPDILVINESMSGEDFLYNLKTDFASNHPPDVFGLWPGSDLEKLIELGMVADLKPIIESDQSWGQVFDDDIYSEYLSKEHVYSIPFELIYEGLFINKTILDRYRIAVPENFEDLANAVKRLRSFNVLPIAYNNTPEGSYIYQNIVASIGGVEIESDELELFEAMKIGADKIKYLYDLKAFPEDAFMLDDYSRDQLFRDGKAAMIVQGSWFINEDLGKNNEIVFIPFPYDESNKRLTYGLGNGNFHISSNCYEDESRKDAAILFLKYLVSKESVLKFDALPGFISSLEMDSPKTNQFVTAYFSDVAEHVKPVDHLVDRSKWERHIIFQFPMMLEGQITVEALLNELKH
ncbi:ABC transporter substrate-binding protein [Fusibacter sp. 3D3]|uniref:ABC transporter substrate-binding protein n=1 Tax=Fusibacter sp. 3D3 TaxID=1048380 RepID=UPI000A55EC41|nr:extracellular solute-binding protein [Fusibacter sp. 3D3]